MIYLITYIPNNELITYISNNEQRILEWVTPAGWGPAAIGQAFAERFPAAQLLNMEPQP